MNIQDFDNFYINYTSDIFDNLNKLHYYRFWYHGNFIDIKCKEKFNRGDVVKLLSISDNEIIIEKTINKDVKDLAVLILAVTRIPLGMNSDFQFHFLSKQDIIILKNKNIKNKNSSYLLVTLCKEKKSKLIGIDSTNNVKIEFAIE